MSNDKKITVTLTKSPIGYNNKQRLVVQSLGLGKMGTSREHFDSPMIRGMINKVSHLVTVTEGN